MISAIPTFDQTAGRTIDFVEKDNARLCVLGFLEKQPQLSLGLSNPLAETVRPFSHEEGYKRCDQRREIVANVRPPISTYRSFAKTSYNSPPTLLPAGFYLLYGGAPCQLALIKIEESAGTHLYQADHGTARHAVVLCRTVETVRGTTAAMRPSLSIG